MKKYEEAKKINYILSCILYSDNNTHAITFYIFIRKMATGTNTHNLGSNSNTKDALTPYDEVLACDNLDNKKYYNVH